MGQTPTLYVTVRLLSQGHRRKPRKVEQKHTHTHTLNYLNLEEQNSGSLPFLLDVSSISSLSPLIQEAQ